MYMFSFLCTVVGSLVMRLLKDGQDQLIEPGLSILRGGPWCVWYLNLDSIIAVLLEQYNAGGPGVVDKLRGLYYVHYNLTSLYWS